MAVVCDLCVLSVVYFDINIGSFHLDRVVGLGQGCRVRTGM